MLHVNDDNNDELFRRAADNYPLKTDSADWDALRTKIDAAASEPRPEPVASRKKYRLLWLLLLLIPLGILENKYKIIGKQFSTEKPSPTAVAPDSKTAGRSSTATTDALPKNSDGPVTAPAAKAGGNSASPINSDASGAAVKGDDINNTKAPVTTGKNAVVTNNPVVSKDQQGTAVKKYRHSNQRSKASIQNALATTDADAVENGKKRLISGSDKRKQKMSVNAATAETDEANIPPAKNNTVDETLVAKTGNDNSTAKTDNIEKTAIAKNEKNTEAEKLNDEKNKPADKKIDKEVGKTETKVDKKENKKGKERNKHFYVGLMAGPDFSSIKLQSVKKTGLNYGFIAGYKINKRFSVETGIFKDRKFYSSKGQYFSTKNIYLPPNATIEYVDGECNMLEVPLNFNYSFWQRKRSGWFASAGVSSYFMKDESYVYDVSRNGYRYPYSYKYKNKSTALLAVVNLSAGYSYKLGKIADLRIEPYIKLPVNKVGTGKLPIQSVGIMVGLTKTIF